MQYPTLESYNYSGVTQILYADNGAVHFGLFPALIIISIFAIISLGSYFATTRRYGRGDFLSSLNVGGFVASIISGIMLIIPHFETLRVVVITVLVEIGLLMIEKNLEND